MEIKFSRHAKRRAKLYNISESIIRKILLNENLFQGEYEIIKTIHGFKYPIKIIVKVDNESAIIITNYPLKRKKGK